MRPASSTLSGVAQNGAASSRPEKYWAGHIHAQVDYAVGQGGVQPVGLKQQGRAAGFALKGHARAQPGQGVGEVADGALVHAF